MNRLMMKYNQGIRHREKGFTLLEMITVVGIITIIITFAIPAVMMSMRSAKESACIKGLDSIYTAIQLYQGDIGYSPVKTLAPSSKFLKEIDPYMPESYTVRHGLNVMIKGYQIFGWVPASQYDATFPGFFGADPAPDDAVGSRNWRVVAVPIEPNSGLNWFYLDPNGNITRTIGGDPV